MSSKFIATSPWKRQQRPTSLLIIAGLLVFLTAFDYTVQLSNIPFLRHPAAVIGIILFGGFALKRLKFFHIHRGPQLWGIAFLLLTFLNESLRFLNTDEFVFFNYMQWAQPVILFIILIDLGQDERAHAYLGLGFLAAICFMAIMSVASVAVFSKVGMDAYGVRAGFGDFNVNNQAYWYAMGLVILLWALLERWPRLGKNGILILALAALVAVALLKTASRGGLLSAVVGISFITALSLRKRNFSALMTLIPLLAGAGFWLLMTNEVVTSRFGALVSGENDGARTSIWLPALDLVSEQPWIGYGPRFVEELGEARGMSRNISSHNSYLQVALTFGVPLLLVWLMLIGSVVRRCWRERKAPAGALFFALLMATMAFAATSDVNFNRYFWVLLALGTQVQVFAGVLQPGLRDWDWKTMLGISRRSGPVSFRSGGQMLR